MRRKKLGGGYHKVELTKEEKESKYSLTEPKVANLISFIACRQVGEEILTKYREAEKKNAKAVTARAVRA